MSNSHWSTDLSQIIQVIVLPLTFKAIPGLWTTYLKQHLFPYEATHKLKCSPQGLWVVFKDKVCWVNNFLHSSNLLELLSIRSPIDFHKVHSKINFNWIIFCRLLNSIFFRPRVLILYCMCTTGILLLGFYCLFHWISFLINLQSPTLSVDGLHCLVFIIYSRGQPGYCMTYMGGMLNSRKLNGCLGNKLPFPAHSQNKLL